MKRLIVAAILMLVSAAAAVAVYLTQYRVDSQTDNTVAQAAVTAASEGTVALLSYASDSLDRDLAAAKSHLTGYFLGYYTKFTDEAVKPAAAKSALTTTASVMKAGISELRPDVAKVLVFLNQTTTRQDRPEPAQTASMVLVTLTNSEGRWLISEFTPV